MNYMHMNQELKHLIKPPQELIGKLIPNMTLTAKNLLVLLTKKTRETTDISTSTIKISMNFDVFPNENMARLTSQDIHQV